MKTITIRRTNTMSEVVQYNLERLELSLVRTLIKFQIILERMMIATPVVVGQVADEVKTQVGYVAGVLNTYVMPPLNYVGLVLQFWWLGQLEFHHDISAETAHRQAMMERDRGYAAEHKQAERRHVTSAVIARADRMVVKGRIENWKYFN